VQWVLKFADEYDHDWPLIEHATMRLGKRAGIRMCETQAVPFASRRSAIAVRRFDRGVGGARFHCISAAVALRAAGETSGYPELASVFRRVLQSTLQGPARAELFRRMVFNIVCDNTDDHERNHALVLRDQGWELSDAFDVVPSMQNLRYQALRVGRDQLDATLENAMSECAAFGLSKDAASQIIRQVCKAVSGWRDVMRAQGVHARDIEALEPSFEADKAAMRREFLRHAPSTPPSRQ
jgi:serine/threonine-protein kinase HipA